ncbi:MAG: hypothetical protein HYV62_14705 [Candidatus Rokubacteria bacterium]|nr:hypothetical protein [Candidatus Rokubacteria bacterium]
MRRVPGSRAAFARTVTRLALVGGLLVSCLGGSLHATMAEPSACADPAASLCAASVTPDAVAVAPAVLAAPGLPDALPWVVIRSAGEHPLRLDPSLPTSRAPPRRPSA